MSDWHVLVDRDDYRNVQVVDATPRELGPGEARLQVRSFGLTANNVTYAAAGDLIGYWSFFPAPATGDDVHWGRVPVWGFADVIESRADGLVEGERLFGYLPMSSELVIEPTRVTTRSLVDGTEHRSSLPVVYNQYVRCVADPGYSADHEAEQMIYWPLFFTSFLIDDALDDQDFFGADTVLLGSASSKTAIGTAFLMRRRDDVRVLGLTSASNAAFVRSLDCYDQVHAYRDLEDLPDGRVVFVDMSGDGDVVRRVHERYGDDLLYSMGVGLTHWDNRGSRSATLPGPAPQMFFAPSRVEQRRQDWGPDGLEQRLAAAWTPFLEFVDGKVRVEHHDGPDAVADVFTDLVENRASPDVAHVLHP